MKITQIKLTDFHQFKDLTIDLTYPKGHGKEGQPLDKVCFIGQSGTGKTSLLELIPLFLFNYKTKFVLKSGINSFVDNVKISFSFGQKNEYSFEEVRLNKTTNLHNPTQDQYELTWDELPGESILKTYHEWDKGIRTKLIYLPANLNFEIEIGSQTLLPGQKIIDFSIDNMVSVWNLILDKVQLYQEQELQIRQEISKTVEQSSNNLDAIKKALKKLEDWKEKEFNPIQDIADNCLDRLLAHFKLKVKTELDIKSKDDIGFIKIEDFAGNEIPHGLWGAFQIFADRNL